MWTWGLGRRVERSEVWWECAWLSWRAVRVRECAVFDPMNVCLVSLRDHINVPTNLFIFGSLVFDGDVTHDSVGRDCAYVHRVTVTLVTPLHTVMEGTMIRLAIITL
jgi:hypothetical protein